MKHLASILTFMAVIFMAWSGGLNFERNIIWPMVLSIAAYLTIAVYVFWPRE